MDTSGPAGADAVEPPRITWADHADGALIVTIEPPPGRRLSLASVALLTAGAFVPLVAGVVAAPADVAVVVRLTPAS